MKASRKLPRITKSSYSGDRQEEHAWISTRTIDQAQERVIEVYVSSCGIRLL